MYIYTYIYKYIYACIYVYTHTSINPSHQDPAASSVSELEVD